MIICGYPGVGKSTYAACYKDCLDLESSLFDRTRFTDDICWAKTYVELAEYLEKKNKVVFVSTHRIIVDKLMADSKKKGFGLFLVYPEEEIKSLWIEKLKDRAEDTGLDKDIRAYYRAEKYFDSDISYLKRCEKYHEIGSYAINEEDLKHRPEVVLDEAIQMFYGKVV